MIGLLRPLSGQELSDGRDQPSASPHDRGHDGPQPLAGDPAILCSRGVEVQPIFRPIAGDADAGGRAHLPGPPRIEWRGHWASLNQTVAALRFFYGITLGMSEIPERIVYAREPRRLPVVLSADE